jgi:hypothetical protein
MVKAETYGVFNNFDKLCDSYIELFSEISKSRITEEEEGCVLYMVKRDAKNPEADEVLSLCKVKTLEYRLFRKMREKLKNYCRGRTKKSPDYIVNSFKLEAKELISCGHELC